MNVTTVKPGELTPDQVAAWSALLDVNEATDSPFFHPEYVRIIGSFRPQIDVGVVTDNGQPIAFFPFERHRRRVARPVGGRLCDLQGVIADPRIEWRVEELLHGCALKAWRFDHLLAKQPALNRRHLHHSDSPYMDLSDGFDAYAEGRLRAGSQSIKQTERKRRKLEREVGPLRFEWHATNQGVFQQLLRWKSAQRQRTGTADVLQRAWVVEALDRIRLTQGEGFAGVLSALYVGDDLVAAHFGMRTATCLHYWFPAYSDSHGRYSPGSILLLEMAKAAADMGIRRLDLGKGPERYKSSFKSGAIPLVEGAADLRPLQSRILAAWLGTREWVRGTRLRPAAVGCKRALRSIRSRFSRRHQVSLIED